MSIHPTLRLSPADRVPGDRGLRGRVAALLVVAAVLTLALNRLLGTTSGGGGGDGGGWSFQASYPTSGWSGPGLWLSAALLLCGGTALWVVRTKRFVLLAVLLSAVGFGALAWTIATAGDQRRLPLAVYRRVGLGTPESQLTARLGPPVSTDASARPPGGGLSIGCLVYRASSGVGMDAYLFCFDRGRLRVKLAM